MNLTVNKRAIFGKKVKNLRQQGLIPAELYGRGIENLHLAVPLKDLRKVLKEAGETSVINLEIDGQSRPVMIYDVSHHPISDEILTVDFYQVRLDEKIRVKVPIEFIGESPAVRDKDGVLIKTLTEIEVEALPGQIPHSFTADLSQLKEIGDSLKINDLVVAVVKEPAPEEEATPVEEKLTVESVVVESEVKKKERESEKQSEKPEEQK